MIAPARGAALLALAIAWAPLSARADTLVDNVQGRNVTADGRIEPFVALLFDDAGTIRAVYRAGEKLPKPGRRGYQYHVDGQGRVMLPGLIDSHVHVIGTGLAELTLDLSDTRSLTEALDRVRAFGAAHPDRPWLIGGGWNQERWGLGRFPTAAELDAAVPDKPVWLQRVDGHAGWANSAALRVAGVTAATRDPDGGQIDRAPGGSPAGVLVDNARALVDKVVPPPGPRDIDLALATAQRSFVRRGLTAVADMGTTMDAWQAYRRAGDANRLYLRIMAYADGVDAMIRIAGPGPSPWLYGDRLRLGGVKIYLDGALGSRGAWLKAPYADAPGSRGLPRLSETQLGNLMSRAAMDDFQVAVHAIGDQADAVLLGAIEDLSATYKGDRRWRIEHAQVVDPADRARVTRIAQTTGLVASMQPLHQPSDRTMAEARLGPDRLAGAYSWRALKAAGALLAFGSDSPVEPADPFAGMAAALTRQDAAGNPPGGWQPQERVDIATALAAYTAGGARAGFAEMRFGRLAPGLRADFVLVDTDPTTASPDAIRRTRVLETWVGGGKVWDATDPDATKKAETARPERR